MSRLLTRSIRAMGRLPVAAASATIATVAAAIAGAIAHRDLRPDVPVPDPAAGFVAVQSAAALVWAAVALALAQRRDLAWWWLASIAAFSHAAAGLSYTWAIQGLVADGWAPGAEVAAAMVGVLLPIEVPVIVYMVVSLPSGSIAATQWSRWRWTAVFLAGAGVAVNAVATPDTSGTDFADADHPFALGTPPAPVAPALLVGGAVLGLGVLIATWRRSRGWTRLALRWVVWTQLAATVLVVPAVALAPDAFGVGVAQIVGGIAMVALVTVIRRQRLLGVERLFERTLLIATLATTLGVVYVAAVVAVSALVDGDIAAPVAAAAVALAVLPLRDRLQQMVDRFVYGDRTGASEIVHRIASAAQTSLTAPQLLRRAFDELIEGTGSQITFELVDIGTIESTDGPSAAATAAAVELVHRGSTVGWVRILEQGDRATDDAAAQVVRDVAPHLALLADACRRDAELQRARSELVRAREEERRRLRHDLHDGLGPILTGAAFSADAATNLTATDPERARQLMTATRQDVTVALDEIRRIVEDLRPPALDELGLVGAIRQHAERFPKLQITIRSDGPARLPAATEVAAYRITTEAVTNVARHARAARADIDISCNGDLLIQVGDDGIADGDWVAGVGLSSMYDRATELGGSLEAGPRRGGGSLVTARLPLEPS